ncbi:MAG: N-acetylmuramoyl-L-alanine amidase [Lentisphaeria bacterium]|nr:N-acetylmuramoyl-L-alanine amidase [Lentisphaeria bacterium]
MNKNIAFFLTVIAVIILGAGCKTHPAAEKRLAKYAPAATEENCLLKWRNNTFKLHPNRQFAVFNGMPIQLPAAPLYGEDKVYKVTPMTLRNIIDPLMTGHIPPRQIRRILVDPGHGGNDMGAPGKISKEKDLNFLLAREIAFALQKKGFQVAMTRTRDVFLPLRSRVDLVKKYKADLFISVHHNASKRNPAASGIECFAFKTPRSEDTLLAVMIQESLIRHTGSVNRGVKFANFSVLRGNPVPAVLIEAGFVTNAAEEKRLVDPRWRRKAAAAVAGAVTSYARKSGKR